MFGPHHGFGPRGFGPHGFGPHFGPPPPPMYGPRYGPYYGRMRRGYGYSSGCCCNIF